MHKNFKLGLVAVVAFLVAYGAYRGVTNAQERTPSEPISPRVTLTPKERQEKMMAELQGREAPQAMKKVENALNARFGHLGEEVMTATAIDAAGEQVHFVKRLVPGVTNDGKILYAQAAMQATLFQGELVRDIKPGPNSRFRMIPNRNPREAYFDTMKKISELEQRGGYTPPAPMLPPSGK